MPIRPHTVLRSSSHLHNAPLPRGTRANAFLNRFARQQQHDQQQRQQEFKQRQAQWQGSRRRRPYTTSDSNKITSTSQGDASKNNNRVPSVEGSMESHWGPATLPRRRAPLLVRKFLLSLSEKDLERTWQLFMRVNSGRFLDSLSNHDFAMLLNSLHPREFFHKWGYRSQLGSEKKGKRGYWTHSWDESVERFWGRVDEVLLCMRHRNQALTASDYTHLLECARWTQKRARGEEIWKQMREEGIRPTTWTYNSYIALGVGTPKDGITRLVTAQRVAERRERGMITRIGDMETRTRTVFNEMLAEGLQPSSMTVDLLILGSSRYGDLKSVFEFLSRFWGITFVQRSNGEPVWLPAPAGEQAQGGGTSAAAGNMINNDGGQQQYRPQKEDLLERPLDVKFTGPTLPAGSPLLPTSHSIHCVVTALCQNFRFDAALQAFDALSEGYKLEVFPQTWSALMRWAYTFSTRRYSLFGVKRVLELHKYIMERHKYHESDFRITGWLFRAYLRKEKLKRALHLLSRMRRLYKNVSLPRLDRKKAAFDQKVAQEKSEGLNVVEIRRGFRDFKEYKQLAQATRTVVKHEKLLETWSPKLLKAAMTLEVRFKHRKRRGFRGLSRRFTRNKSNSHRAKVYGLMRQRILKDFMQFLKFNKENGSLISFTYNLPRLTIKRGPRMGTRVPRARSKAL